MFDLCKPFPASEIPIKKMLCNMKLEDSTLVMSRVSQCCSFGRDGLSAALLPSCPVPQDVRPCSEPGPGWEFTLCFCPPGDAEIGSNNVSSLKSGEFRVRGFLDELSEEEIWGSSHTLKSCGKAVSIETASLSEYARYVLRTICQQVTP